jgi:uncharacterized protein
MLLQVGPLQFSIAPMNAHEITREADTDYAKKEVVGRRKIYEHVGEGDDKRTIQGKLFPLKTGGAGALQLLHTMRETGSPQYCMRGDGYAMGWFVIVKVHEVHRHLSPDGVGQEVDVTITLERADSPGAMGAFMSLFGLAP